MHLQYFVGAFFMEKFVIYRDSVSSQENILNTLAKTIKMYDKKT